MAPKNPSSSAATCNPNAAASAVRSAPPTSSYVLPATGVFPAPPNRPSFTPGASSSASAGGPGAVAAANLADEMNEVTRLILELRDHDRRGHALWQLSKKRQLFHQMAPIIWFSFGTMAILMQELVAAYPFMSPPPEITTEQANRACNALALFQCIALHPEISVLFARAWIPYFLCTFIEATSRARSYEHLRLCALGVMGSLVKTSDTNIINFLLTAEIMPMCLHAMEAGSELSRVASVFMFHRIILNDMGLNYMCHLPERLIAANHALANLVISLREYPSARLLKLVIRCYLRLSENPLGRCSLKFLLPPSLIDGTFNRLLAEDPMARIWIQQLVQNLSGPML